MKFLCLRQMIYEFSYCYYYFVIATELEMLPREFDGTRPILLTG